ncbi:DNA-binding protein BIN4 isoform X1 [Lactuca sativa]|uniref:DNA-binding protein BIN4 isoform X1 n=1 Tax=Lactuca sativa TaxID=4236 RepID=UPI0022AE5C37|nr:DNA-binding protein BIN4 isoform X1 [Lactuca sativa]
MSTSSREYSPDWLRNAQAPTTSILMLSSSSESLPGGSDDDTDDRLPISSVTKKTSKVKSPSKNLSTKRKGLGENEGNKGKGGKSPEKKPKTPVWTLPSDFEYELSEHDPKEEEEEEELKTRLKMEEDMMETQGKQENDGDVKVLERQTTEKQTGSYISSSRLPLVLADKVQRSKALVECEGESIDLSGDLGSVGRVVVSDCPSGNQDVLLDLKVFFISGTIYKMTILPSRTFCVVSFGQSEAKIEAIMDDFIQLKPQSNVYEAETMVEGTLEGFSFDSEDEAANRQTGDENKGADAADPQTKTNGKGKGKAEKTSSVSGAAKRKAKTTAAKKPPKKATRKAPAAKKSKAKK